MNLQTVCRCGMAIAVPAQYAGRTIQCGNCRQPVVVPDLTAVPSPPVASSAGHASPEESNPLAMTGFVLSLVSSCAIALGPMAEGDVLVALNSPDHATRMHACRVLEEIGTARSLPALRELTEDRFLGRFAQSAIESIEAEKREAVSPPQE